MKLNPFSRSERRALSATPDAAATMNGVGFGFDVGSGSRPGRAVSHDRALGTSAVYSCVTLLMKLISSMPLQTFRNGPDGSVIPVKGTPLANTLRYEPQPGVTAIVFWATVVSHLLLRGNAFLMKIKVTDAAGRTRVSALRILHPDRVQVLIDDNGDKVFRVYGMRGGSQTFTRSDVLHIAGMSFGTGLVGHSVIAVMRHRLSGHVAASDHQDKLLSSGLTTKATLKIPGIYSDGGAEGSEEGTKRGMLRSSIRRFYGGSENAGNVLLLDNDWELQPVSISPHDAQFLETYKHSFTEVAGWFTLPAGAINADAGSSGLHYTTASWNDLDLLKKGCRFWLKTIEEALLIDPDLFGVSSGRFARFNVDALLEADILTRMKTYQIGTGVGMYSPNDALRIEGRPLREDEGGDEYVTPARAKAPLSTPTTDDEKPQEGTIHAPEAG